MTKTRREFAPEFKREAVALLESSGRPLMQVATEVGISPSMLRNWRATIHTGAARSRAVAAGVPQRPSPADQAAEIARLKRSRSNAHGARRPKKRSRAGARLWRIETAAPYLRQSEGSGRQLIGGAVPVKKRGPWVFADLRMVTSLATIPFRKMTTGMTQTLQPA